MRKTRVLSLLFVLALVCIALPAVVLMQASAATSGDYEYSVSDGEVTITKYIGSGGDAVIPSTIDGYPVTKIGYKAFYGCETITGVVIPDGITVIEDYLFQNCKSLKSITIPDGVTYIGRSAFANCISLENIDLPITVTKIQSHAFDNCHSLKSIVIPKKVTVLEELTFAGCRSLTSITLSDRITKIKKEVFHNCESLQSIHFPASVESIVENTFLSCYALRTITVDENNPVYYSKGNCLIERATQKLVAGCGGSVIPDEVLSIGDYAFNSSCVEDVIIPSGVTSIGASAFNNCRCIKYAYIPESVTTMGYRAFSNCTRMENIYCEANEKPSGWDADWIYTGTPAEIHWGCTCSHKNRTETIIKEATVLEDGVLEYTCTACGATGTETFMLPGIDRGYCGYTSKKIMWTFDASTGTLTLSGSGLTQKYDLMNPDWIIYKNMITSLVVEEGITGLNYNIFDDLCNLQTVRLPNSLGEIRNYAFTNSGITSITIPERVYHIGIGAFKNCDNLKVAYINQKGNTVWYDVFDGCGSLTDIYCAAESLPPDWYVAWLGDCTATVHWGYKAQKEELKFASASLTLQESLTVNFKVDPSLFGEGKYKNPYVKFVLGGKETIVTEYSMIDGRYVFAFKGVLPDQMTQTITATLFATFDGALCESVAVEYSIATYCYNTLNTYSDEKYAKLRTLLVDLLNYGAAAQKYTKDVSEPANARLTDVQKAWGTSTQREYTSVLNAEYATIATPSATWKSCGLNLTDEIGVRLGFELDSLDNVTVKIVCGDYTKTISAEDFLESDGRQYIFVKMTSTYMSEPLYATVYSGTTAISNTICYSVETYANKNIADVTLTDLLRAMMNYGDAAYNYIH